MREGRKGDFSCIDVYGGKGGIYCEGLNCGVVDFAQNGKDEGGEGFDEKSIFETEEERFAWLGLVGLCWIRRL